MSNEFYIFGGDFHNTGANIKQQNIIIQGDEPTAKEERAACNTKGCSQACNVMEGSAQRSTVHAAQARG